MTEDLGHEGIVRAGIKVGYCLTDFPAPQSGFTMFAPWLPSVAEAVAYPSGPSRSRGGGGFVSQSRRRFFV